MISLNEGPTDAQDKKEEKTHKEGKSFEFQNDFLEETKSSEHLNDAIGRLLK